jgi:hypothetical protein
MAVHGGRADVPTPSVGFQNDPERSSRSIRQDWGRPAVPSGPHSIVMSLPPWFRLISGADVLDVKVESACALSD